jgi:hypothetical protein
MDSRQWRNYEEGGQWEKMCDVPQQIYSLLGGLIFGIFHALASISFSFFTTP